MTKKEFAAALDDLKYDLEVANDTRHDIEAPFDIKVTNVEESIKVIYQWLGRVTDTDTDYWEGR